MLTSAVDSAIALRVALERTADAMAEARLDELLSAGEGLDVVFGQVPTDETAPGTDSAQLRAEVEAARAALTRCRRLGVSLGEFVRVTIDTHGVAPGYDPSQGAAALLAGRGVNTSV